MIKKLLGVALVLIALEGMAFPTQAELRKARPLVDELMDDHVKAYNAVTEDDEKESAAETVGDEAVKLEQQATGEAAKLLFLHDAFKYYVLAKNYDKAAQSLRRMQVDVKDTPPGTILTLIKNGAKGVTFKEAPLLRDLFLSLQVQKVASSELRRLRLDLKSDPTNKTSLRQYGDVQAILGDWQSALEAYAKLKGDVGDHARAELEGKELREAADFWWTYKSYAGERAMLLFRAHAAILYRKIFDELEGLLKNAAEKRLQQLAWYNLAPMTPTAPAKPKTPDQYLVVDLSSGSDSDNYPISGLAKMPAGGWTDEYKTTKLVMRLIGEEQAKASETSGIDAPKPYYIGVFEVTQKQYELVTGKNPSRFKSDVHPVEQVSYFNLRGEDLGANYPDSNEVDADSFMGKLRSRTDRQFDLPSEQQWEFACRAGTATRYSYGDDPNGDYMWYRENSDLKTHTVGKKLPNQWGLYDMHGNVWEWCLNQCPQGLMRGGNVFDSAERAESSRRYTNVGPNRSNENIGFRLVCAQDQAKKKSSDRVKRMSSSKALNDDDGDVLRGIPVPNGKPSSGARRNALDADAGDFL